MNIISMKRPFITFCFALLALIASAGIYTPQTLPNPKSSGQGNCVCNPDGIISPEDVRYLNQCAARFTETTSGELCVIAIDNIGDYDAFDFTYEVFQRWGIGKQGKNTGVLLILVLDSRDIRIMTGGGIEGILTDAVCNRIIQQDMMSSLKQGNYSAALCIGALRIYEICTDGDAPEELRNASSVTNRYGYADNTEESFLTWMLPFFFFIGIFMLLVWIAKRDRKCPKCGKRTLHRTSSKIITNATYRSSGIGLYTYRCRHCGHTEEQTFVIPRKTRTYISGGGGGGSFGGGFSGGSFGGGSTFGGGAGSKF